MGKIVYADFSICQAFSTYFRPIKLKIQDIDKNMTVAIMGCVVNGPGEAREADIGIAGGKGQGILFKKGETVRKIPADKLVEELLDEINKFEVEK